MLIKIKLKCNYSVFYRVKSIWKLYSHRNYWEFQNVVLSWVFLLFFTGPTTFYVPWPPPWFSFIGSGGFATIDFSGVGLLVSRPTHNPWDQGLHFIWPLPFDLSGMGDPTRSLRSLSIALHVTGAQTSSPRQDGTSRRFIGKYVHSISLSSLIPPGGLLP
jgi:hypothetical protein